MDYLTIESSIQSEWQNLVIDAGKNCNQSLDEDLESYLVFLLMRYTCQADLANTVVALEYMEGMNETREQKYQRLRDVGDKSLLFSGLFPQSCQRRLVNLGYYINIGRSSYEQISHLQHHGCAELYHRLAGDFIIMTDILHSMRELGGAPAMSENEKYRFWIDYDSQYACQSLKSYYGVIPFRPRTKFKYS